MITVHPCMDLFAPKKSMTLDRKGPCMTLANTRRFQVFIWTHHVKIQNNLMHHMMDAMTILVTRVFLERKLQILMTK